MKRERILITGSSGQSGKEIAKLLSPKYDIVGIDKVKGTHTQIIADLTDRKTISEISKNVTTIIHTASLHAPHIHSHTRENFIDTNIKGTLYLLEAANQNKVKKFIYTSTTSLYGESMDNAEQAVWITEDVCPKPRDIYDITKLTAEELCRDFFDQENLQTVSLRVSRFWDEPLPNKIFFRMYRGIDVRDVAMAHQLALNTTFNQFEVFNISAQTIFEKTDLLALRKNLVDLLTVRYPKIIELFETKGWDLPNFIDRVYVIDKAKKQLQFFPKYNIDRIISELN